MKPGNHPNQDRLAWQSNVASSTGSSISPLDALHGVKVEPEHHELANESRDALLNIRASMREFTERLRDNLHGKHLQPEDRVQSNEALCSQYSPETIVQRAAAADVDLTVFGNRLRTFQSGFLAWQKSIPGNPGETELRTMVCSLGAILDANLLNTAQRELLRVLEDDFKNALHVDEWTRLGMITAFRELLVNRNVSEQTGVESPPKPRFPSISILDLNELVLVPFDLAGRPPQQKREFQLHNQWLSSLNEKRPALLGEHHLNIALSIYLRSVAYQSLYDGNNRTGWILANDWLINQHGAYLPFDETVMTRVRAAAKTLKGYLVNRDMIAFTGLTEFWFRNWALPGPLNQCISLLQGLLRKVPANV